MKACSLALALLTTASSPLLYAEDCLCHGSWSTVEDSQGSFDPRHEADYVRVGDKFYLLGGRGNRALNIYDPKTNHWTKGSQPPVKIHHYQALAFQDEIWAVGAFTGGYPKEKPYPFILIYRPEDDSWRQLEEPIPRPRGGGGLVAHGGKIYLICGITNGHLDGHVSWLDCYDPATKKWTQLPDAPRARDHFRAVVIGDRIYNTAGRRSAARSKEGVFGNTVAPVDYYDFKTGKWHTLAEKSNLPTPRAGNAAIAYDGKVLVIGGESNRQGRAYNTVEALDPAKERWMTLPPLLQGRHGTGVVEYQQKLYIASGAGNRGNKPELETQEVYSPSVEKTTTPPK